MKILIINYEFPPLGGGGSPVCFEIAKGYVEAGHTADVVTMHYKDLPYYEIIQGIGVYRVSCLRRKKELCTIPEMITYVISAMNFLRKHLKGVQYDIIHAHFVVPSGIIAYWAYKNFKIPYIVTTHGSDIPGYNEDRFVLGHLFTKPILRLVCNNAQKIISPSLFLKDLIKRRVYSYTDDHLINIPNGIHPSTFELGEKKSIILSTGRLLPRKGFQYLIKAVSSLNEDYELHICGDGPMMSDLKDLAKHSTMPVIFHGWLSNTSETYKNLLKHAAIYCLASSKENASIALLEALSSGCAVVTTNVSGCPESVGDAGMTVAAKNVDELRTTLQYLMDNDDKRIELQNRARARTEHTLNWSNILNKYITLLKYIVEKNYITENESKVNINIRADKKITKKVKDNHFVSVVIPTLNRSSLSECRQSLKQQTRKPDEIIFVVDKERKGPSWAKNKGIRQAKGDIVAFIDDDCIAPKDWLANYITAIDKYNAAGSGSTYLETEPLLHALRIRKNYPTTEQIDNIGLVGAGGNVVYVQKWLLRLEQEDGYIFNESMHIAEDWELAWRIRCRQGKLVFTDNKVKHLCRLTPPNYIKKQFGRGVGIADLRYLQKRNPHAISAQKSILWSKESKLKKLFRVFWFKGIGPFDVRSFPSFFMFTAFWFGEKVQAVGFLAQTIKLKYNKSLREKKLRGNRL